MAEDIGGQFMAPVLSDQRYRHTEAAQPAELAQKYGAARYTNAMASRLEAETAADKSVAAQLAAMAGGGPLSGGNGSISGRLNAMSEMYAKAGQPSKAAQLAQQASQAAAHEATARKAQWDEAAKQATVNAKEMKVATELLGGVTDQASWETANQLFEQQTGHKSPFANLPYDKDMVKLLGDSATSAYQKQLLALRDKGLKLQAANVASSITSRATRDNIALENLRVREQREQRLAKQGGKDLGSPSKAEIEAAGRLLGDTGLEGDDKDSAAFSIASEAKAIRRKNPGISSDEALRQAKLQAQQEGAFIPDKKSWVPGQSSSAKFTPPPYLPLHNDPSKLTDGQVYRHGDKIGTWDAKANGGKGGWKNVQKLGMGSSSTSSPPTISDSPDGEDPGEDDGNE